MRAERSTRWVHWQERLVVGALIVCASISVVTTLAIAISLGVEAIGFFQEVPLWRFLTEREWTPLFAIKKFGILPLVCGAF